MKLIDKDVLIEEIRRLFGCAENVNREYKAGSQLTLTILEEFINSLEVKEVDLEDYGKLNTMLDEALSKETSETWNERFDESINEGCDLGCGVVWKSCNEPVRKNYRERYKHIAQSDSFKKSHEGMSIGEVMHVEGEEPANNNLEKEIDKYIQSNFTIDKEQLDRFGIEEKDYVYSMDKGDIFSLVSYFTNWQKQQDKQWLSDNHKQIFNNGYEEGFEAGRDDMEDEMTKDSIPAEIMQNKYGNKYISSWAGLCQYDEFKVGDKIKIKIIDEN